MAVTRALHIDEDGLTEADLVLIEHIAQVMTQAGAWERVDFCPSEAADFIEAYETGVPEPVCGIGRHRGGLYVIADYDAGVVMIGTTLLQALERHAQINPRYAPALPN